MSLQAEPTTTMRAYAEAHGEPDPETSARLEQQLERMIQSQQERGSLARWRWLALGLGFALFGVAGLALGHWLGAGSDARPDAMISALDQPQRVRLSAGTITLEPGARLWVLHDEGQSVVELHAGTIEVESEPDRAGILVLSGRYSVALVAARARIEHAAGIPIVTAQDGEARVRGDELPPAGVTIVPVAVAPSGPPPT